MWMSTEAVEGLELLALHQVHQRVAHVSTRPARSARGQQQGVLVAGERLVVAIDPHAARALVDLQPPEAQDLGPLRTRSRRRKDGAQPGLQLARLEQQRDSRRRWSTMRGGYQENQPPALNGYAPLSTLQADCTTTWKKTWSLTCPPCQAVAHITVMSGAALRGPASCTVPKQVGIVYRVTMPAPCTDLPAPHGADIWRGTSSCRDSSSEVERAREEFSFSYITPRDVELLFRRGLEHASTTDAFNAFASMCPAHTATGRYSADLGEAG